MLTQIDLAKAQMDEAIESANRHNEARRLRNRGSPLLRLRLRIARGFVLAGARLHGQDPAVIGRVVILDPCGHAPTEIRLAA